MPTKFRSILYQWAKHSKRDVPPHENYCLKQSTSQTNPTWNIRSTTVELYIVCILEESNRTASCHGEFYAVDDKVPHAPDEPFTDVLSPIGHRDHLGAKEHVVTVQVQHVVGARCAAVCGVRAVNDDLGILAEALDDDGVPVAVIDVDGVNACEA